MNAARGQPRPVPRTPRILRRPEPGWASLLLISGMLGVVGLSIAEARPLLVAGVDLGGTLVTLMVAAGLVGFVLARSRLGIVAAHAVGASVAAILLLLIVSAAVAGPEGTLLPSWAELTAQLEGLSAALQGTFTNAQPGAVRVPTAATYLLLGALCWTTGQFAAFGVFRYERAGPAVMASGILLFLNVALRALEPPGVPLSLILVLAGYSAMAMLLLLRLQLLQQGRQWARRHIADTGEVARLFLRTGVLFVALSVAAASSLTLVAAAPVPDIDAGDLRGPLEDLGTDLADMLAWLGVPETGPRTSFGDDVAIQDVWQHGEGTAFTAVVADGLRGNYWWGAAYSRFDGERWHWGDTATAYLDANEPLLLDPDADRLVPISITATVSPEGSRLASGTVLGPAQAAVIDRRARVKTVGAGDGLAEISLEEMVPSGDTYSVESLAGDYAFRSATFSARALRDAGTDYPAWVRDAYLTNEPGTTGPLTRGLARTIEQGAIRQDRDTAYDKAFDLQKRLRDTMDYTTDIRPLRCEAGVAECLLADRQGFCQHFATTMVLVLREMDIPARYVTGFLPGLTEDDVNYTVPAQALHAWVEVYFPGYGWVRFDPTPPDAIGAFDPRGTQFQAGDGGSEPEDEPPADDRAADEVGEERTPEPSIAAFEEPPVVAGSSSGGGGRLTLVLGAGALAVASMALLMVLFIVRLRRLPGSDASLAYRGIASLAARLGHGPLPSQTEHEFATSLSETLPGLRGDLYLVVGAHVETAYGRRRISQQGLVALRGAYARVRTALLRLFLRRGG